MKVKHPSEKSSNPVDEVLFFKKPKTPQDFPIILEKDTAPKKVQYTVAVHIIVVQQYNIISILILHII